MNKAQAETLIIAELRKMFAENPMGSDGGLLQYMQLSQQRPDLFDFKCSGDPWQVVKGWMNKHNLG
ncbi:MAG: hypothetical protein AAFV74_19970 [Pseudomonadota bacterium]